MDPLPPLPPVYHIEESELHYLLALPGAARVFLTRLDNLSSSREVALVLKEAVDERGWMLINEEQLKDSREIDYSLRALEQTLEQLAVADEVAPHEEDTLHGFTTRLSVDRSVCHDQGIRAVVLAVHGVISAARSQHVQGDDAEADPNPNPNRVVTAVRTVARALVTAVDGVIRAARSPHSEGEGEGSVAAGADLVRADPSLHVEGNGHASLADLIATALAEVKAARARPVLLQDNTVPMQVSSLQGVDEILSAGPPHSPDAWSTTRVLDVRSVEHLRDVSDVLHNLQACAALGWRVHSSLTDKLGQARGIDCLLILLNYKLKLVFDGRGLLEDGKLDPSMRDCIGKQIEKLVKFSMDGAKMFQAEIATIPELVSEVLDISADRVKVHEAAHRTMEIIGRIRSQQLRL